MSFLSLSCCLVAVASACAQPQVSGPTELMSKPPPPVAAQPTSESDADLLLESNSWAPAVFSAEFFGLVVVDRVVYELCSGAGRFYIDVQVEHVSGPRTAPHRLRYSGVGSGPRVQVGDRLVAAFNSAVLKSLPAAPQCLPGGVRGALGQVVWAGAPSTSAKAKTAADRFYRLRPRVLSLRWPR